MSSFIFSSSIGRKLIMSITGLALVLFLTFHCIMNIFVIISPAAYDAICEFLGANWYAIVGSIGLALLVLIHIIYAFCLSYQNYKARGNDRYAVSKPAPGVEWAARNLNMLVLGVIILGFLGLHLYNFWVKMQLVEIAANLGHGTYDVVGSELVKATFQSPVYCLLYLVWFAALWFHLTHGIWSGIQTLGGSNGIWLQRIKKISNIYATIVIVIFAAIPVYYLITNLLG